MCRVTGCISANNRPTEFVGPYFFIYLQQESKNTASMEQKAPVSLMLYFQRYKSERFTISEITTT